MVIKKKIPPFVQALTMNGTGGDDGDGEYFREKRDRTHDRNSRSSEILRFSSRIMRIAFCQKAHLVASWTRLLSSHGYQVLLKSEPVRFPIAGATITLVRGASSISISGCRDVPLFSLPTAPHRETRTELFFSLSLSPPHSPWRTSFISHRFFYPFSSSIRSFLFKEIPPNNGISFFH